MSTTNRVLPLLALACALSSCMSESSGKLSATKTGDLSAPLAPKEAADAKYVQLCGEPTLTGVGEASLQRNPYLQRMTQSTMSVAWTAKNAEGSMLRITTPDGEDVLEVDATVDDTTILRGAKQLHANVRGLEPGTFYCYSIANEDGDLYTNVGFQTAPSSGPARFLVFGDSGEGSVDQDTLAETMNVVPYDFMLHVGDMAYEDGSLQQFEANYFDVYESLLDHFSVFPVPGNHEYETADAAPYREVFDLPNNERWYSFDWADVHFVALDTERVGNEQTKWLETDLGANTKPWTVVYFHKPPYSSGEHGSDLDVRKAFSPIMEKHGVDLVLSGHDHDYERMVPQNGVHYIVTGGGGAKTYGVSTNDFSAFSEEVVHFLYVTVDGDTLTTHAIDATGEEFDQLVIEKDGGATASK